jgi:hypothetical protein
LANATSAGESIARFAAGSALAAAHRSSMILLSRKVAWAMRQARAWLKIAAPAHIVVAHDGSSSSYPSRLRARRAARGGASAARADAGARHQRWWPGVQRAQR